MPMAFGIASHPVGIETCRVFSFGTSSDTKKPRSGQAGRAHQGGSGLELVFLTIVIDLALVGKLEGILASFNPFCFPLTTIADERC